MVDVVISAQDLAVAQLTPQHESLHSEGHQTNAFIRFNILVLIPLTFNFILCFTIIRDLRSQGVIQVATAIGIFIYLTILLLL